MISCIRWFMFKGKYMYVFVVCLMFVDWFDGFRLVSNENWWGKMDRCWWVIDNSYLLLVYFILDVIFIFICIYYVIKVL